MYNLYTCSKLPAIHKKFWAKKLKFDENYRFTDILSHHSPPSGGWLKFYNKNK